MCTSRSSEERASRVQNWGYYLVVKLRMSIDIIILKREFIQEVCDGRDIKSDVHLKHSNQMSTIFSLTNQRPN